MKTTILIVFILITRVTLAQHFSEFEKIHQIADSIWANVRIHGPHYDGRDRNITYYRIDENNYIREEVIFVNDTIREAYYWYVFKSKPIMFVKREIINYKLNFDILYFISNKKVIGLQLQCIGYFSNDKILEIEKSVEKELIKENWTFRGD